MQYVCILYNVYVYALALYAHKKDTISNIGSEKIDEFCGFGNFILILCGYSGLLFSIHIQSRLCVNRRLIRIIMLLHIWYVCEIQSV